MKFSLNTKIIYPDKKSNIKSAIVLLHGYGGDGNEISLLTINWKRFLPNTVFLCPDGHEPCPINSTGFQWFDLTKDDTEYILQESILRAQEFFDQLRIANLEVYIDDTVKTANQFSLRGLPTTILINKKGEEFARILGAIDFDNEKFIEWLKNYD